MYELTCPACGHKVERPFVRVGARAACEDCQHRYQIGAEQVVRNVVMPPEESGADNPLLLGGARVKPPPPMSPSRVANRSAGAAAAATAAAREPAAAPVAPVAAAAPTAPASAPVPVARPAARPTAPAAAPSPAPVDITAAFASPADDPTLHTPPSPPPSPTVARMIAQRKAARTRGQRIAMLVIAAVVLLALIVGGVIWLLGGSAGEDTTEPALPEEPELFDSAASANWSVRELVPLALDMRWKRTDEALPTLHRDGRLEVSEARVAQHGSEWLLTARLTVAIPGVIEMALLELMLVDSDQRVFARLEVPQMLLAPAAAGDVRPSSVAVRVPEDLARRVGEAVGQARVVTVMEGGDLFRQVVVTPTHRAGSHLLLITAFNPLDRPLRRAVFCVSALDRREVALRQWQVNWTDPVAARHRVEFAVAVPAALGSEVTQWQVRAAAEARPMFGPDAGRPSSS